MGRRCKKEGKLTLELLGRGKRVLVRILLCKHPHGTTSDDRGKEQAREQKVEAVRGSGTASRRTKRGEKAK
jgi:hypothetical protein